MRPGMVKETVMVSKSNRRTRDVGRDLFRPLIQSPFLTSVFVIRHPVSTRRGTRTVSGPPLIPVLRGFRILKVVVVSEDGSFTVSSVPMVCRPRL